MLCSSRYERRKEPEKVRAALIDAAATLICEQGLSRMTIDAVARLAGVTKGGLFHHFASKEELIQGVLDAMVAMAEVQVDTAMAADPERHGSFTRAYLGGVFAEPKLANGSSSRTLCLAMLADPKLQGAWFDWVAGQVARHAATDDNPACALVRLAADGIWLNSLRHGPAPPPLSPDLQATLIGLTRPDADAKP